MADKLTNKPITPSREMLELLKEWAAPDVTEVKKATEVGKTNFMGVPLEEMYNRINKEEEPEEEEVPQLTAEEIEQIRQDAYNEGFEQGKQDGFVQGKEEGLIAGQEQGLQQGLEEGKQQGLVQGQDEIDAKVSQWQQLIEQLYQPINKVDQAAEQQLLNLAVMLAEAVIRVEIKSNKEALLKVLHDAVSSLPFNTEYAELHMHPDDVLLLRQEYSDAAFAENKWIIKEQPSYRSGDIVVATPNSLIDQTVKQRIKQSIESFVKSAALNDELNDGMSIETLESAEELESAQAEVDDPPSTSAIENSQEIVPEQPNHQDQSPDESGMS